MSDHLASQFAFLSEIEKLRHVDRHNLLLNGSRVENSAEHSWHLTLYALILQDSASPQTDLLRVIQMLLLHDIVEIDVGDNPIHHTVDWQRVAKAEQAAAVRIFGLLPAAQGAQMGQIWQEFETAASPEAKFARSLDRAQPVLQTLCCIPRQADHLAICRENIEVGRAKSLASDLPQVYAHMVALLEQPDAQAKGALHNHLAFLNEADQLKSILRASRLGDGSRHENSAEHSWHILMFAWVLAEHSHAPVDLLRVFTMLILHDLVEIDAGDAPIHGVTSPEAQAAIAAKEQAAADRLFGILPSHQGQKLRAIWDEFEAAHSDDAIFAKAVDRVQPVLLNKLGGGGSWIDYDVTLAQIDARVGAKVAKGAPSVWQHVRAEILPWFVARNCA